MSAALPLDRKLLDEVSSLIAERMGLHFPEERWADLARGLKSAAMELGWQQPGSCLRWIKTGKLTARQFDTLASHLTVGETYFFRDPASFEALEQQILPPLVARRANASRTLRLWSAGCCTGEEAYSLAISCCRTLPDLPSWNVSVLATDINSTFLAKAEAGVYSEWSFRGSPTWLRERFFSRAPNKRFAIDQAVQQLVQLGYLNLAEDPYPSLYNHTNAMDVIFCRNVLMYLTPSHQRRVVAALHDCLVDGGYLLVNPAEASSWLFPMFVMKNVNGAILYRKTSGPPRSEPWPRLLLPDDAVPAADPACFLAAEPAVSAKDPASVPAAAVAAPAPAFVVASDLDGAIEQVNPLGPAPSITAPAQEDLLAVARTYANQGRLEEALTACGHAIEGARTSPAAYFLRATICHELGRLDDAATAFGKVLYLDQDFILAHHALSGLHKRLGKHKESKRHLAIAHELLSARSRDEIVPESGGMTCGRLLESVRAMEGG